MRLPWVRGHGLAMNDTWFIGEVLIFLLAAVVVAPLFQRLKSSPVLGFLVAGMLIGPHGLGFVAYTETTRNLAELGVVFLLFSIGLELTMGRLKVMRRAVFGLGVTQVTLTGLIIGVVVYLMGQTVEVAIIIGIGLAFSSTAVVLQLLSERGELATRFGRACFAILLLQDLAVVPMLTLVPALVGQADTIATAIGLAAVKAVLAFAVIFLCGRLVLRPLFHHIAVGRSPELFAAMTLLVLLGSAWLTSLAGLSPALGGFLAGVMLAETEYRHQVAADIHPFRGILMGLFFMSVGMAVDLGIVVERIGLVTLLVGAIIALKALVVFGLCRIAGLATGPSANAGLMLAQGGEFAFLLFILAISGGLIAPKVGGVLFVVVALTMALTPLLAVLGGWISRGVGAQKAERAQDLAWETEPLRGHVIVAGYGRVGQAVSAMLKERGVAYVALDLEPERVARARAQGLPVFYGDAARPELLRNAGVAWARAAVLTMDDPTASERAAAGLRHNFPDIQIFARARDNPHKLRLETAGATGIVPETHGLSLELGGAVLKAIGEENDAATDAENDAAHRAGSS